MLFLFCFSEKGNILCTKFLFLQKSAQMQQLLQFPWLFSCYRLWFTTYNSRWVYFLLLLSKFYCYLLFSAIWKGFIHGVLSLIFLMFVRIGFFARNDGITFYLVHRWKDIVSYSMFHLISQPVFTGSVKGLFPYFRAHILWDPRRNKRKRKNLAVFNTSHVTTSWDKRKNLAFIVIHHDQ